ncbi:DUF1640 domain-containing protein [Methylosinus sp. H3A]|uniref:DUF1640 domain-containing protein n=1 Tax=Methylosinus sp. H3A TaxID=2785786 RepID=UPI0018C2E598|nr:DUF1640 domain-containing protein [Methylosinus sp. H3A]MBG0811513.1 DUF1640 domain-containing protein [Methylosinus sp. H3A]
MSNSVPFDTLKFVEKLEAGGFTHAQAKAAAEAFAEATTDIASVRSDIEIAKRDLKIWFGAVMVVAVGVILAAIRYLPHGN